LSNAGHSASHNYEGGSSEEKGFPNKQDKSVKFAVTDNDPKTKPALMK
jgi:hypothetical protein